MYKCPAVIEVGAVPNEQGCATAKIVSGMISHQCANRPNPENNELCVVTQCVHAAAGKAIRVNENAEDAPTHPGYGICRYKHLDKDGKTTSGPEIHLLTRE